RRVISSGGGRRRPEGEGVEVGVGAGDPTAGAAGDDGAGADAAKPIVGEVDPELERLIAEEEEIERRTREHHEAPHFKKDE
ncbi:MAG: hypothetical protein M3P34_05415, partial [Actinomycetota bacterium]|nr:hypothetical protein [Actinomycetota bacterium]